MAPWNGAASKRRKGLGMKSRPLSPVASIVLASIALSACSPGAGKAPKTVSLTDVAYAIINRPVDWYSAASSAKPTLVYDFSLFLSGNMAASDIEYARVYLPNDNGYYWSFNPADCFDPATKELYGGFYYGGREVGGVKDAGSGEELPIGLMRAEVRLLNGATSTYSFLMGVPGNASPGANSFVYNPDEEAAAVEPALSAAALRRPTVTGFTAGGSSLVVSFMVNGNDAHNGWVWFYDGSDVMVGKFYPFRAAADGTVSDRLAGSAFNRTDGAANTLTVSAADVLDSGAPVSGARFASIRACRVAVCDGAQYEAADRWAWYDYKAVSAEAALIP
jgi:hypothetical protein